MNVQVKKIVMGDGHTLVLGENPEENKNIVFAMGDNTEYLFAVIGVIFRRQLGVSNNSLEWTPKRLCQEWKHDRKAIEEPDFPGSVTHIFAGGSSSICVDKKGFYYFWGADILGL